MHPVTIFVDLTIAKNAFNPINKVKTDKTSISKNVALPDIKQTFEMIRHKSQVKDKYDGNFNSTPVILIPQKCVIIKSTP